MNDAHYHLILNHLPIIFPLVGAIVMMVGYLSKSEAVKRTGYLIFVLGAVCTLLAVVTGEGAEKYVRNINGFDHDYIEAHEEAAETFAMLSYILGAIAIVGIWASYTKKKISNVIAAISFVLAIVVLLFAQQAGTTGGEIRHDEIRQGASVHSSSE